MFFGREKELESLKSLLVKRTGSLVTPVGLARNDYAWSVQSVITLDDLFRPSEI